MKPGILCGDTFRNKAHVSTSASDVDMNDGNNWSEMISTQVVCVECNDLIDNDGDGKMMRTTALDMNEQEMQAVAAYIYGLK